MKLINKLILNHLLKYYDETFVVGSIVKVSFRIHHLHIPQFCYIYLKKHLNELSQHISEILNRECLVSWFEVINGKFLIVAIEPAAKK